MDKIYNKLKEYSVSDYYPYHMPGHKRKLLTEPLKLIAGFDITEIHDFDNLADAEGILKDAQDRYASYLGVKKSFYLVNGSTVGILTAICAAVKKGGKLLIARNAHKSTYHAMCVSDIEPVYIYPEFINGTEIYQAVTPEQVSDALNIYKDIDAVIIVSPTYEGRIADVRAIADIAHNHSIPLIVDEAHGSHLGFSDGIDGYGKSACHCGADLIIQSLHKTIPAPTQTAVLHYNSELIDLHRLEKYLHVFQTSSPSYPLMACIESAVDFMIENGQRMFTFMVEQFTKLVDDINCKCTYIEALPFDAGLQDVGKLIISARRAGLSGKNISDILREDYHLELEMSGISYCLAMFTVADEIDAYDRLRDALIDIDHKISDKMFTEKYLFANVSDSIILNEAVIPMSKAWDMDGIEVDLHDAEGQCANDFIGLYPPGTPILVPGERITSFHISELSKLEKAGYEVTGISEGKIRIISIE